MFRSAHSLKPLVFLAALASSPASAASSGSGYFSYKDSKLEVKYAYAVHPRQKDAVAAAYVYLTDKPIDAAALTTDSLFPDIGKAQFVRLCITAEGQSCGLFHEGFNTSGVGNFKLTTNTATRIEGAWTMDKPDDFFGKKYQFDLHWATDFTPTK